MVGSGVVKGGNTSVETPVVPQVRSAGGLDQWSELEKWSCSVFTSKVKLIGIADVLDL